VANAILIAVDGPLADEWVAQFRMQAPARDLRQWPHGVGDPADIAYACVWRAPPGLLAAFANLKAIFSLSAGVDHVLADPLLPNVPLARAVHENLTGRMTEYVVLHVLMHHRGQRRYDAQQRARVWQGHEQPAASEVTVGILGLGAIGSEIARALARIGFQVAGWSRTAKRVADVESFHAQDGGQDGGHDGLDAFLARSEILVCLLPHTPATEGLLNLALLRKLKRDGALGGAFLVNAARGKLQLDADIIAALDEGTLAGATLDVFPTEPLPTESPLWAHPKITLTPHNAGDLAPRVLACAVLAQIGRVERGEPLENVVDRAAGY
jgi:glyoxylate/hydroxypyruvate reductase